jgi:hypothetical protein
MKLQEQIKNILHSHFTKSAEADLLLAEVDKDLEKTADDYAIGFAEYLKKECHQGSKYWNYGGSEHTEKELLQIYKETILFNGG